MEKSCFFGYYNGYEIILPKKSVVFKYGFGIVEASYVDTNLQIQYNIIGIVDENYRFILNFLPKLILPKIEIFPNHKFIALTDYEVNHKYEVGLFTLIEDDLQSDCSIDGVDFEVIDDKRIIISDIMDQNFQVKYLFDVEKGEIISPYINYLGNFQFYPEYNCIAAEAIFFVYHEDLNDIIYVSCFINSEGQIVSDYKESYYGNIFPVSLDLSTVLDFVHKESIAKLR